MAPIGPQMPPQLTKRKRTPIDGEAASPAKRHHNDSDSGSDSDIGPAAPKTIGPVAPSPIGPILPADASTKPSPPHRTIGPSKPTSPRRVAGPALPPTANDSDSDDEIGPAPHRPVAGPRAPPAKRAIGPSMPPPAGAAADIDSDVGSAPLRRMGPTLPPTSAGDSDSDSDYGPSLPTAADLERVDREAAAAKTSSLSTSLEATAPKRDDWMLAPPSSSSSSRAADPTKIRARGFATGPRANITPSAGGTISSIWTETAAEKAQRIADSVLGRAPDATSTGTASTSGPNVSSSNKRRTEAEEDAIRRSIAATRGPSLLETHRAANAKRIAEEEEMDDPSKRAFDREKDMAIGGRGLGGKDKREVIRQAKDFGGRFGKGGFL